MNSNTVPIIIFDTETNGLTIDSSVLSISAIKIFYNLDKNIFLFSNNSFPIGDK